MEEEGENGKGNSKSIAKEVNEGCKNLRPQPSLISEDVDSIQAA